MNWAQASAAVGQLVQAEISREQTGYRRNRLFTAMEVLALMDRPFGTEPVVGSDDDGGNGSNEELLEEPFGGR